SVSVFHRCDTAWVWIWCRHPLLRGCCGAMEHCRLMGKLQHASLRQPLHGQPRARVYELNREACRGGQELEFGRESLGCKFGPDQQAWASVAALTRLDE